jgi:hypothetical protein
MTHTETEWNAHLELIRRSLEATFEPYQVRGVPMDVIIRSGAVIGLPTISLALDWLETQATRDEAQTFPVTSTIEAMLFAVSSQAGHEFQAPPQPHDWSVIAMRAAWFERHSQHWTAFFDVRGVLWMAGAINGALELQGLGVRNPVAEPLGRARPWQHERASLFGRFITFETLQVLEVCTRISDQEMSA